MKSEGAAAMVRRRYGVEPYMACREKAFGTVLTTAKLSLITAISNRLNGYSRRKAKSAHS